MSPAVLSERKRHDSFSLADCLFADGNYVLLDSLLTKINKNQISTKWKAEIKTSFVAHDQLRPKWIQSHDNQQYNSTLAALTVSLLSNSVKLEVLVSETNRQRNQTLEIDQLSKIKRNNEEFNTIFEDVVQKLTEIYNWPDWVRELDFGTFDMMVDVYFENLQILEVQMSLRDVKKTNLKDTRNSIIILSVAADAMLKTKISHPETITDPFLQKLPFKLSAAVVLHCFITLKYDSNTDILGYENLKRINSTLFDLIENVKLTEKPSKILSDIVTETFENIIRILQLTTLRKEKQKEIQGILSSLVEIFYESNNLFPPKLNRKLILVKEMQQENERLF